jgi:hypothetical protein
MVGRNDGHAKRKQAEKKSSWSKTHIHFEEEKLSKT